MLRGNWAGKKLGLLLKSTEPDFHFHQNTECGIGVERGTEEMTPLGWTVEWAVLHFTQGNRRRVNTQE